MNGGEGGIRTHVPVTRQDAFEAPPLRPLRYLSINKRVLAQNYNCPVCRLLALYRHHPANALPMSE